MVFETPLFAPTPTLERNPTGNIYLKPTYRAPQEQCTWYTYPLEVTLQQQGSRCRGLELNPYANTPEMLTSCFSDGGGFGAYPYTLPRSYKSAHFLSEHIKTQPVIPEFHG